MLNRNWSKTSEEKVVERIFVIILAEIYIVLDKMVGVYL